MARKRFTPEQIIGIGDLPQSWDHGADLLPLAEGLRWDEGFAGQASQGT
jgi:hypothetical protein